MTQYNRNSDTDVTQEHDSMVRKLILPATDTQNHTGAFHIYILIFSIIIIHNDNNQLLLLLSR